MPPPPRPPEPLTPACLKPHEVTLFAQGQLPPERRQRVEAHLPACARCQALLARADSSAPSRDSLHHVKQLRVRPEEGGAPHQLETRASGPGAAFRRENRAAPRSFEPGGRVSRYTIERVLGEGGMGAVYLAHDPELNRRVAIKLLHAALSSHPEHKARFLREAQAMASVSHPNVVTVHDIFHAEDQLFVAMEYVEGSTLREWLRTPRSTRQVLELFQKAGAGLAAAHAAGLIHRDFKPGNVLIGVDGSVRVSDFGLARLVDEAPETPMSGSAPEPGPLLAQELTQTGLALGTPGYMSPEQMLLKPIDGRSDQFSFCVALHEALYGRRPFAGKTLDELFVAVKERRFQTPRTRTRVPAWLHEVVRRGLSFSPEDRFPHMEALLQALARDPEREEEGSRARVRRRARRGVLLGALATALVMAIAPTDAWRGFEERAQGLLLTSRPRPWNSKVVVLGIDQPTITKVGWPQPRMAQARMVQALTRAGVKAVGIDSFLYLPARDGPEGDAALGRAIADSGRVVLAVPCTVDPDVEPTKPSARLEPSTLAPGSASVLPCARAILPREQLMDNSAVAQVEIARSASGNVRGAYLLSDTAGRWLPTFALAMYLRGRGLPTEALVPESGGVRLGNLHIPMNEEGATLASFRLPGPTDVLSYGALYEELGYLETPTFPPELAAHLKGKYVLVGQTAESIRDMGPFANGMTLPLVFLHASLLSDLLEQHPVREVPLAAQLALIALCGALLTAAVLTLRPALTFASVLVVLLGVPGGALLLAREGVALGPLAPMVASVLSFGLVLAGRISAEERERSRVRTAFEGYVDETELDRLLSGSESALPLEGSRKRVSVLFARVQGAPGVLEQVPPEEVVRELRQAFQVMTEEVLKRKGRVDSLRGGGLLAVFGDPQAQTDHARRAVEAAVALRSRLAARDDAAVALEVCVGVATGEALVGNVGLPGGRWEYAVLGSPLEQAQDLARRAPAGGVLVAADTRKVCGGAFDFVGTPDSEPGAPAFVVGRVPGEQAAWPAR
jgi:CHASE2 domain-containing sensor protein/class 3 adenylate cyclase/predicted Ser/Thr protein kinase